jgi:SNF2 family DNA or RNA helicase
MTWQTKTSLYAHQIPAVEKLVPSRVGALFMDMGTGKTRSAIELVCIRQSKIDKAIWFCPVSLKETIRYEIEKHTTAKVYVFDDRLNIPVADWYIVGIESMSMSDRTVIVVNKLITENTFVIVDESAYIKSHKAIRTQRITRLAEKCRYRLILTGTPITQGIQDLFAQMRFLSPKILGYHSFYSFAANHLEYSDKYPGLIIRAHNTDWLAAKINPYVYQITKEEAGLNLPDKLYDSRYFGLTEEQRHAYEVAKFDILMSKEEIDSYVLFQLFTALQQIVSGFYGECEYPSLRLDVLQDVIESIPENEKVIIWCKYRYSVRKIAEMLPDAALYYGDLSEKERNEQLNKFRSDCRYLIATQATGSHGLTLNEAHYSIFYENEFNYSHRKQAEDRNHRIGQINKVTYIDILSRSGIEDRIMDSLSRKSSIVKDFKKKVDTLKDKGKKEVKQYLMEAL